jgi:membrane carboxypeptidase/penicillin-binding protein PbpC
MDIIKSVCPKCKQPDQVLVDSTDPAFTETCNACEAKHKHEAKHREEIEQDKKSNPYEVEVTEVIQEHFKMIELPREFARIIIKTFGIGIDYKMEIQKARYWLDINEKKKKNYKRYLFNWIGRVRNRMISNVKMKQFEKNYNRGAID